MNGSFSIFSIDIQEIKQIVELVKQFELTEFELEEKDLKLRLCRASGSLVGPGQTALPSPTSSVAVSAVGSDPTAHSAAEEEEGVTAIKSPMVGTFYRAPTPDSKPFVDVGVKVRDDSVVCIIEAMKVMNEITAEMSGTVIDVLVENGQAVEYGQPLFRIKK